LLTNAESNFYYNWHRDVVHDVVHKLAPGTISLSFIETRVHHENHRRKVMKHDNAESAEKEANISIIPRNRETHYKSALLTFFVMNYRRPSHVDAQELHGTEN
jgi:hypothetical protein